MGLKRAKKSKIPTMWEVTWDAYKSSNKDSVDLLTFRKVQRRFFQLMSQPLAEGQLVQIPFLGKFQYVKQRSKRKQIDWGATKKYNKLIKYANLKTNGYLLKVYWDRKNIKPGRLFRSYNFNTSTTLRRLVSGHIKEDPSRYKNYFTRRDDLQIHKYKSGSG